MRRSVGSLLVGVLLLASLGGIALATDAHKVDPYVWTALSGSGGSSSTVGRAKFRSLCGDGDGCTVRLLQESDNGFSPSIVMRHRHWSVATDADGREWSVHMGAGSYNTGSIDDSGISTLLQVTSSNGDCYFREDGVGPSVYKLVPFTGTGIETVYCTLRLED